MPSLLRDRLEDGGEGASRASGCGRERVVTGARYGPKRVDEKGNVSP